MINVKSHWVWRSRIVLCLVFFLLAGMIACGTLFAIDSPYVSVEKFGAVSDAVQINGKWSGKDNASAFNECAAYCRKTGMTMLVPKGNYGVASTVWLTNPDKDGHKQAALTIVGSNKGAFLDQNDSANICVLSGFKSGKMNQVKKNNGNREEPDLVPVLGISSGRQVQIEGIGIQGNKYEDLICGVAIGNVSQMVSLENCSLHNIFAGVVFPGIRKAPSESVLDGNNDLLKIESSSFTNAYNIVCAGTQPFACDYRSNRFSAIRNVFTGTLITNYWGQSVGSHTFTSNLLGSIKDHTEQPMVYFDLALNEVTIDSNHFETAFEREIPEVLIRQLPNGGSPFRSERLSFTNNFVNMMFDKKNPSKSLPIFDVMTGSPMIIQGNHFRVSTAVRIKAPGAILIGNSFNLSGPHDLAVVDEQYKLDGNSGNIGPGKYDFNHLLRVDSGVSMRFSSGAELINGKHYRIHPSDNAYEITAEGKAEIDKAGATDLLINYSANDASHVEFKAWGADCFNPPSGWDSRKLTAIGNKVCGVNDRGMPFEQPMSIGDRKAD